MSNKTQLQTNNTALASLTDRVLAAKDTAAALPDAGGGSVETCTVTHDGPTAPGLVVYYVDESLQLREATSFTITVLKNSIIYAENGIIIVSGNATAIGYYLYSAFVGGDCSISTV